MSKSLLSGHRRVHLRSKLSLWSLSPHNGSAFKAFARIHGEELTVIRGEGDISSFEKGQFNDEHCKTCGSLLFSRVDGGFVHVTMGTLIDAPSISPTEHIFVGSKALGSPSPTHCPSTKDTAARFEIVRCSYTINSELFTARVN